MITNLFWNDRRIFHWVIVKLLRKTLTHIEYKLLTLKLISNFLAFRMYKFAICIGSAGPPNDKFQSDVDIRKLGIQI